MTNTFRTLVIVLAIIACVQAGPNRPRVIKSPTGPETPRERRRRRWGNAAKVTAIIAASGVAAIGIGGALFVGGAVPIFTTGVATGATASKVIGGAALLGVGGAAAKVGTAAALVSSIGFIHNRPRLGDRTDARTGHFDENGP
jgi:hypothetical protein